MKATMMSTIRTWAPVPLNLAAIGLSWTDVETGLKVLALALSITYTLYQWWSRVRAYEVRQRSRIPTSSGPLVIGSL